MTVTATVRGVRVQGNRKAEYRKNIVVSSHATDQHICSIVKTEMRKIADANNWTSTKVASISIPKSGSLMDHVIPRERYKRFIRELDAAAPPTLPPNTRPPPTGPTPNDPPPPYSPPPYPADDELIQQILKASTLDYLHEHASRHAAANSAPATPADEAAQLQKALQDSSVDFLTRQLARTDLFANGSVPGRDYYVAGEPSAPVPRTPELVHELPGDFPGSDADETDFDLSSTAATASTWDGTSVFELEDSRHFYVSLEHRRRHDRR